jgi:hypothetical protein
MARRRMMAIMMTWEVDADSYYVDSEDEDRDDTDDD